ncbi:MAG: tRNA (guanosine(46)-N7)-methyltransferase TrmB [Prevotellaceae bacterium]|jgi:tRNA (guanine-N7-)-methyltransferase|nr:tRNA (guanosine(46)-N7)-methyltransferase TrmB [Prevotellaceae bacterium]
MGKNKLQKFGEMETFPHVFQFTFSTLQQQNEPFELKGKWNHFFQNDHPVVLELGCGRGEYTVALAELFPDKNFIGVDIKGARMWAGAKESFQKGLKNVAFIRTNIEIIPAFFGKEEISEIWLTFPDPQMKKAGKRLTSTRFMGLYQQFVKPGGIIHLKTDSNFMFTYTSEMVKANGYKVLFENHDLYHSDFSDDKILSIKTFYEQQWLDRGLTIKYIKFLLTPKETFVEPEVDIEYDSYRSYNRSRRSVTEKRVCHCAPDLQ